MVVHTNQQQGQDNSAQRLVDDGEAGRQSELAETAVGEAVMPPENGRIAAGGVIQWFPGHMTAARKKAAETLAVVDVVVELLDARLPFSSGNPLIDSLRRARQRPCLKVLNKADLADPAVTAQWLKFFARQPNTSAIPISAKKNGEAAKVLKMAQQLAPHRSDAIKPLRLMMMGIPNVGKSTLMNLITKKKVAAVGDMPAVTKSIQRIDISSRLVLYDTPGLMWPKIDSPLAGYKLAASHAIGVNAYDALDVAQWLAGYLLARYPALLAGRYRLPTPLPVDGYALLEAIGKQRGCRLPAQKGRPAGEIYDVEKAAHILLTDLRTGKLGRLSLEAPADLAGELVL